MRFNIETKLTPTSGAETPDPDAFADAVAAVVREAGMTARVSVQSFDWRTLAALRRIAPEIERACLTVETPNDDNVERGRARTSPWTAGLDIDDFGGSVPRWSPPPAATSGRPLSQRAGRTSWRTPRRRASG